MLSAPDSDLVRRDRAVPGLAVLLDTDAFLELLSEAFPAFARGAAGISYLRYKPHTSCLCAYQIVTADGTHSVYAKAFTEGRPEKLRHWSSSDRLDSGDVRRRISLRWHLGISRFPDDRRLKALSRLRDEASQDRIRGEVFGGRPCRRAGDLVTLRYKPERRYVASLTEGGTPFAVLKMYDTPAYEPARACARLFTPGEALHLPRLAGESAHEGILAFDWIPGPSLDEELTQGRAAAAELAGAALAELHGQDVGASMPLRKGSMASAVRNAVESVAAVCPELAAAARGLAGRIESCLDDSARSLRPAHGDFNAQQVIMAGNGAAILDFDRACLAHPAADLGSFAAHVQRVAMRDSRACLDPAEAEDALIAGYARNRPVPPLVQIRAYTAAALLRLAPEPFRYHENGWPDVTAALLEKAGRVLGPRRVRARSRSTAASVVVPHGAALESDARWSFLREALDPREVPAHLAPALARAGVPKATLREIKISRHKPGRRCLIEYAFEADEAPHGLVILGKSRIKGLDANGHFALESLWDAGFTPSRSLVSVPQPLGAVPAWRMTLQRKVEGTPASAHLAGPDGVSIATRIAEAIHVLHTNGSAPKRTHTIGDELQILQERLSQLSDVAPPARIRALLDNCVQIAAQLPGCNPRPVHRDFYPAHVLVEGGQLWLIDLDLYSAGDTALDVGNFLAHMIEERLRREGTADGLSETERAFESRYVQLAGSHTLMAIRAYTTLSLARHVHLSTQYPERRHTTRALLELCERRLSNSTGSRMYA